MTPFSAPHNHFSHPKPLTNATTPPSFHHHNNNNNNNSTTTPHQQQQQQFCYEPTSVLDLRRSPSPVLGGSDSANLFTGLSGSDNNTHLNWDDQNHILHHTNNNQHQLPTIDDWDSMMLGLEEEHHHHHDDDNEKDDSTLPFKYPPPQFTTTTFEQPHNNIIPSPTILNTTTDFNQNNLEFDCVQLEQLIRAAASVESNDLHLAQVILARLNQTLISPTGNPLQRAALYFKEALLQLLLSGSSTPSHHLSNSEIVHKIKAYKSFSEISPITMFANFTANQAFLEALEGSMFIHIIDFEIGLGGHWASFMQELASKGKSRNSPPSSLRITAVILEEASMEAKLIRENLQQFAQELGIQFQLEFLLFNSFQLLLFSAIRFINGEVVAVNLSPSVFQNLRTSDSIAAFLRFLRRITPRITVFVDEEGCSRDARASSFRRNFVTGLEFYSSLLDSLDAANSGDGELIRRIERLLLRPKIAGMVAAAAANCILPWREMLSSVGMVPVQLSEFTDSQAEWLVRRAQVRGFHVAKRQGAMLLCWHERELVATSAWRVG